jgi:uncharacterized protein (TIGR02271 family)
MAGRTNDPRNRDTRSTPDDRHTPDERPRVAPLSDLNDFQVAENEPDIRGWKVRSSDSREVGKVKDLIADTGSMKIRYLDIELDKKSLDLRDDRRVLVPVGAARLNDDDDLVLINRASSEFATLPEYSGEGIDRGYEDRVRESWGSSTSGRSAATRGTTSQHDDDQFSDRNFFGRRREGRENESYLTRSEEEMRVGKRQQRAGEVDVKKRVETERVSKSVPVTREEVTVERRPASDQTASGKIGEDEVRIPLMAEEAVVEKRSVPQEEVVVRKHAVRDEQQVEADLKKERLDVSKRGNVDRENRDTR